MYLPQSQTSEMITENLKANADLTSQSELEQNYSFWSTGAKHSYNGNGVGQ